MAATWASSRHVRAGRWSMRYRDAGEGTPIVLVHGLGLSSDYWYRNGPPIAAAGLRVLAPDLPGYGRSPGPPDGLSPPEQAQALLDWAHALDLPPAVYVGHSVSCQTVLELAAHAPGRVRGLVLAAPTGARGGDRLVAQAWNLFRDAWRERLSLFPWLIQAYLRTGVLRFWRTWVKAGEHDPLPLLPRVEAPALVVIGGDDPVVRREMGQRFAEGLKNAWLATLEGASHALIYDRAAAFNDLVIGFGREPRPPTSTQRDAAVGGR